MNKILPRRDFLKDTLSAAIGFLALPGVRFSAQQTASAVVSVVRIKNDRIASAVEEAIELLGGIEAITEGKQRIMLKPNLVGDSPGFTTKPEVIWALARLMKDAHKEVLIGEGSAAGTGYNVSGGVVYRTKNRELLDRMQQYVFNTLGYTELARSMDIPLINLHSGEMATVNVPGGFVFDEITLHRSLTEIDLLCSVPMMKTHGLAGVTLGMKNLIGTYPGTVYGTVRGWVHDQTAKVDPSGTAAAVVDMVRANKLGLVVIDGSMAMEGDGPTDGPLVKMDLIIAGTNPLATDMIGAAIMGFKPDEIPTFTWAARAGMQPQNLSQIEVRGERVENVRRDFIRPNVVPWNSIRNVWGIKEIP